MLFVSIGIDEFIGLNLFIHRSCIRTKYTIVDKGANISKLVNITKPNGYPFTGIGVNSKDDFLFLGSFIFAHKDISYFFEGFWSLGVLMSFINDDIETIVKWNAYYLLSVEKVYLFYGYLARLTSSFCSKSRGKVYSFLLKSVEWVERRPYSLEGMEE